MLGRKKLGTGTEAQFHFFEHSATLTGARFVLRRTPADAIPFALARLVAEGFTVREDNLDTKLRGLGSPWLAQAAEIGDAKGSWNKGLVADLIEDTPLVFLNRLQRGISPTLVMAAARELPEGVTELVLYPHTSRKGHPQGSAGAASRLRSSMEAIAVAGTADGTLVSYEQLRGIRNDGSPASQQMVRELLDWR